MHTQPVMFFITNQVPPNRPFDNNYGLQFSVENVTKVHVSLSVILHLFTGKSEVAQSSFHIHEQYKLSAKQIFKYFQYIILINTNLV